jgi:hypothetical protein
LKPQVRACVQINDEDEEPEENEFVDDDGTTFVWDPTVKRFRPEGEISAASKDTALATALDAAAARPGAARQLDAAVEQHPKPLGMPEYALQEMRYVPEEEQTLTLEEALAEDERSREIAEALRTGADAASTVPLGGGHDVNVKVSCRGKRCHASCFCVPLPSWIVLETRSLYCVVVQPRQVLLSASQRDDF